MQALKSLSAVRRSLHRNGRLTHYRYISAQPNYADAQDHDFQDQASFSSLATYPSCTVTYFGTVLVEGRAYSRAAILNRPSSLNALNISMVSRLKRLYESWEENPNIGFVVMKGSGRAFCSGGDVITIYQVLNEGKVEECKTFYKTLYKFVYLLGTYLKPHCPSFLAGGLHYWGLLFLMYKREPIMVLRRY
ncbi:hypothetical protein RJ640_012085 [Escallonia rubra]|uniref:3-hydroxyisobutyryl-CoA hydrolase n=1 Tax=Escallonia rubra TaxID=112253 RepID=A0AA88QVK7_9ASTE|nr:hypothetical protein RJ640_012085 [Escallonia rubra]